MNKKIFGSIAILILLLLSSTAAFASASTNKVVDFLYEGMAHWEQDGLTINAELIAYSAVVPGTGVHLKGQQFYVSFLPRGETLSNSYDAETFDWKWSGDKVTASALMPFTVYSPSAGHTVTIYHQITVTWTATSGANPHNIRVDDASMVWFEKDASATITITTPTGAGESTLNGIFTTEIASFGRQ